MMKKSTLGLSLLAALTLSIGACNLIPQPSAKRQSKSSDVDSSLNSEFSSEPNDSSSIGPDNPNDDNQGKIPLTNEGWKKLIKESYEYCEDAVEQGSALLKNENGTLPLGRNERRVTLLGRGSKNLYYRSGAGGAAPNSNLVVTLDKAFESNGFEINHTVFDEYNTLSGSNMTSPNTTVEQSFSGFYTNEMKQSFSDYGDAAIITFVRIGTENTDPSSGRLDLNNDEIQLLRMVKEEKDKGTFGKVIVLINSPLAMSTDWVDNPEYGIDACLYVGSPGYYGAGGIVHILMGEDADGNVVNPSGHLSNTLAASASSSAAYQNFGDNNVVVYKEGVYVGYKYYETRYEDCVLGQGNADGSSGVYKSTGGSWNYADEMGYPFGFGLSYTEFEQKIASLVYDADSDTINATVEVSNVGGMDGKCSVQLYAQQPYTDFDKENGLGRPAIALMTYDKVDVKAGQKKTVNLSFDRYFLATYDYKVNKTYILEEGDYYFAVGNGAHEALNNIISVKDPTVSLYDHDGLRYSGNESAVRILSFDGDLNTYRRSHYNEDVEVTNQFDDADYNYFATSGNKITYLDRQDWQGTWPTKTTTNPSSSQDDDMSQYYSYNQYADSYTDLDGVEYNVQLDEPITFDEMSRVPLEGKVEDKQSRFFGEDGEEVWDRFVSQMNLDDLVISISDNRGILDIKKVMKPGNAVAEGPEGLLSKFQYGDKRWATGFPTGPIYTGTFDPAMQKEYGRLYGQEALFCGVASVNAPGGNINRTPYGSRASEYMSEDGILSYYTAANVVSEARNQGLIMNMKHAILNNQETGRQRVHTYCNEQAIREIYLRPFEGALTKGHGLGVMTSYNRIGARYSACHEPLMMNVMRGEWNYKGFIIDDALTGSNTDRYSNGPAMLASGTDMFCLDGNRGTQLKQWITQNNDGELLRCLLRANKYIMYAMSRSSLGSLTDYTVIDYNPSGGNVDPQPIEPTSLITDDIINDANAVDYDFDPEEVIVKEQYDYDFNSSELNSLTTSKERPGHYLVYVFEGAYAEGYQGDYSETYANIYLWDDGLYAGVVNNTTVKGYWYNSSFNVGDNDVDCLNLVSNVSKYESIICSPCNGFYEWRAHIYLGFSWGTRSMEVSGYKYYPDVAIVVDTSSTGLEFNVGDHFDTSMWTVNHVLKNLSYCPVPTNNKPRWIIPNGLVDQYGYITRAGTFTLEVSWGEFSTSVTITVK